MKCLILQSNNCLCERCKALTSKQIRDIRYHLTHTVGMPAKCARRLSGKRAQTKDNLAIAKKLGNNF